MLQRLAAAGKPRSVVFKGRFDNARLSDVYAEIDVLVVPSIWFENSPITIHEAFLTRTPVVASGIGGMAEFVRDGVDGLHFRVGDDRDLGRTLQRFLDEPDLVQRLSRDWMPIKTIAEDAAATEFRYDALGRLIERIDQLFVPGQPDPATPLATRCFYDELNRIERIVDAAGIEWHNRYDALDRLVLTRVRP